MTLPAQAWPVPVAHLGHHALREGEPAVRRVLRGGGVVGRGWQAVSFG